MPRDSSEKRMEILKFFWQYTQEHRRPPTMREIGEHLGLSSPSHVKYHIDRLCAQRLMKREPGVARGLRITAKAMELLGESLPTEEEMLSLPFLGYIVASAPIPVEALSGSETIEISRSLFGRNVDNLFALRVQGNSMIDALINDGDIVVFRPQQRVENGELAAVWITETGETTLKRFYDEGTRVRLQPANVTMQPLYYPREAVEVQGKVVLVIRQLA